MMAIDDIAVPFTGRPLLETSRLKLEGERRERGERGALSMAKLITGAEYLPPFPQGLSDEAFSRIEQHGGVNLTRNLRDQIDEVVLQLIEEIEADAARPSAGEVLDRLRRLIRVIRRGKGASSSELSAELHDLLERDVVGNALSSLLMLPREPHIRALAGEALERRRSAMLASALELQAQLKASYAGIFGRGHKSFVDRLIERLYSIYLAAGGAAYRARRGTGEPTGFAQFVGAVATMALVTFDPKVLTAEDRPTWLEAGALEERIYVILEPTARPRRAARARKQAAKHRRRVVRRK